MRNQSPSAQQRTGWRTGDRIALPGGVPVRWHLDPPGRSHRWRRDRHAAEATVVDLSDGGAAIVTDDGGAKASAVGDEVVVGLDEERATVVVVRVQELGDGLRRYGVRILRATQGFRRALLAGRDAHSAMPGRPELAHDAVAPGAPAVPGRPVEPGRPAAPGRPGLTGRPREGMGTTPPGPPVGPGTAPGPPVGPSTAPNEAGPADTNPSPAADEAGGRPAGAWHAAHPVDLWHGASR